jgi:hypothetical protein
MRKKIAISVLFLSVILISKAHANDLSQFEVTCADIGFKKNTEAFGDCVLELVSRNKKAEVRKAEVRKAESLAAQKQLEYERQKEREITILQQQQAIQQQQLAIQQQQAMQRQQEPSLGSSLLAIGVGALIGYSGGAKSSAPSYEPPVQTYQPPQSYNCRSSSTRIGNYVNTDTNCR